MSKVTLRTWATPLTIGAFVLMSVTGVLMFFHWTRGITAVAHEWGSWLFLVGVAGHIAVNLRPFKTHFNSAWGQFSVAEFVLVLAASFFSWGLVTGDHLKGPVEQALVDAPPCRLWRT